MVLCRPIKILSIFSLGLVVLLFACKALQDPSNYEKDSRGLKDFYKKYFSIGVAVSPNHLLGQEASFIKRHFNSLTAENAMKMASVQPKEGVFNWAAADSIVDFALRNNIRVRGHNLCWHNYPPDWFFVTPDGKPASKTLLLERLRKHIHTVLSRYKGKIYAWDVVNEAVDDNPNVYLRKSKFYEIAGEDYIAKAFEYAHEADPSALLFYNDYDTEKPSKRDNVYKLLKTLKERGVPVHGIGMQSHWSIYELTEDELKAAIEKYSSLGLVLHFSELDISVYPHEGIRDKIPNEPDRYTAEMVRKQSEKYEMVFRVFRRYKDKIGNVTFWNLSDRYTWLNDFPVKGRQNYPLLFDINLQPKPPYWKVVNFKD